MYKTTSKCIRNFVILKYGISKQYNQSNANANTSVSYMYSTVGQRNTLVLLYSQTAYLILCTNIIPCKLHFQFSSITFLYKLYQLMKVIQVTIIASSFHSLNKYHSFIHLFDTKIVYPFLFPTTQISIRLTHITCDDLYTLIKNS